MKIFAVMLDVAWTRNERQTAIPLLRENPVAQGDSIAIPSRKKIRLVHPQDVPVIAARPRIHLENARLFDPRKKSGYSGEAALKQLPLSACDMHPGDANQKKRCFTKHPHVGHSPSNSIISGSSGGTS